MHKRQPFVSSALALAVASVAPGLVNAQPATVDVFTSVRFSDNIAQRDDENAEAGFEFAPGIRISHIKDPGQCNSMLDSEFAYLIYQGASLDDQISARLAWSGGCEITPYLSWQASDRLSESSRDNRGTNTVANRERKNVFTTGPQLVVPLGDLNAFIGNLDWRKTNFEENTDNNSERWIGSGRLQREFSPVMQGWVSASYSSTEFDDGKEIQDTSYRVGGSRRVSRTVLSGNFGVTTLERETDAGAAESEGAVWDVRATHALDMGNLFASVSRRLTDVSNDVEIAFGDIRFSFVDSQAVEITAFTTGASFRLENGYTLNGSVFAQDYQYLGTDEQEDILGGEVGVGKSLTELIAVRSSARYERLEFEPSGGVGNEISLLLGVTYQRSRDLALSLDIGHETRDGQGNVAEYSENWVAATVSYNLR